MNLSVCRQSRTKSFPAQNPGHPTAERTSRRIRIPASNLTPVNIAEEKADYVITNNGDDRMLGMEIKACADELKELYKRRKEAI